MSKVNDMITKCQETEASIVLDDIVHDMKNAEASDINNQGVKVQIGYIVDVLGVEEGIKRIEDALN